jgi:hypothetical protein
MAPLPNSFLCFFTYVIAREKQRRLLGGGAIAEGTTDAKNASVDGPLRAVYTRVFASVSLSAMAPLPNSFLCFSRAITYVIMQRKQLGGGAFADGETDVENASVDGPLDSILDNKLLETE